MASGWSAYSDAVLADLPYLYWPLSEPSGATVNDKSGNGRGGTYAGSGAQGRGGCPAGDPSPSFDGSTGYAYQSTSNANAGVFAICLECWYKTTGTSCALLGYSDVQTGVGGTSHDRQLYLDASGKLSYYHYDAQPVVQADTVATNDGNWHHVVGLYDGSSFFRLYRDGVQVASAGGWGTGGMVTYAGYWRVSIPPPGSTPIALDYLNGGLAHAAIYTFELSATRVAAHFKARDILARNVVRDRAAHRAATW